MRNKTSLLLLVSGVLGVGAGVQWLPHGTAYYFKPQGPLTSYLLPARNEWSATDLPLGQTEFLTGATREVLRLDDFAFRVYQRGGVEFAIYAAYWSPKGEEISIASHTPDACWTSSGWTIQGVNQTAVLPLDGGVTWPGQSRRFQQGLAVQYVLFWHLEGGVPSGKVAAKQSDWHARGPEIFENLRRRRFGFDRTEQIFIRVSANRPFAELSQDDFFREALRPLARWGLRATNIARSAP